MIISKKAIPRRTVLRGIGASIALPFLDGMVPALTAFRNTAANPVRRLGVVYLPNGMNMWQWKPATEGALEFTRILEPLKPFGSHLLLLSGLDNNEANMRSGEGAGDHSRGQAVFLTGVHPRKTEGADIRAGVSMDQIVAKDLGQYTQLASLELGLEANDLVGACDPGYSCAYSGTIAWRSETTPLPVEIDPGAVFERLFGDTTNPRARLARIQKDRSILDAVTQSAADLQRGLASGDQAKLAEYLEAVRDVERRIQKAQDQNDQAIPVVERPVGIPDTFEEHAKLMFDLMALAYQSDLTRVCTFLIGREISVRTYPEIGVPEPHHPTSHHQNRPEQLEKLAKINTLHMKMFAHLLERLGSTPDGDGSLLDHSVILAGGGISDSNLHIHNDLPILLAGGGAGQIKGGRHVAFGKGTPLANLHLTLLDKMGMPIERFGDSTGKLELLSNV